MTVQAYLQAKNKQGLSPLYVRYFHLGVFFPVPLGETINPDDFDRDKQQLLDSHPSFMVLNYRITLIKNRLLEVAQEVQLKGIEPTREVVKAAYFASIEEKPLPVITDKSLISGLISNPILTIGQPVILVKEPDKPKKKKNEELTPEDFIIKIEDFKGLDIEFVDSYYQFSKLVCEWITTNTTTKKRTKRQRCYWLRITLEFALATKTSLAFNNFTLKFYADYADWLMFTSKHDLYNNAFGTLVKRLKTFLNWCETIKDITVHKHYKKFRVLSEEKQIENAYLDRFELELLYKFQTKNLGRTDHYRKVIDLTYLQCTIGLRWSDLTDKNGLKVELINNQKVLIGKTAKSNFKQTYQIPTALDSRILEILERYDYNLSTLMCDVEYNRRVKDVLKEMYERYRMHQKPYRIFRYKLTQQYPFDLYKYEMIASHSNRRAFVSWCYKELRLPEKMILKMLGSKSIQELKKYIALDIHDILHAVNNLNLKPAPLKVA